MRIIETPDRLVLRSQHRLSLTALVAAALLLFYGATKAGPEDPAGMIGMLGTGAGFLLAGWAFFPRRTIVFDRQTGLMVNDSLRFCRRSQQVLPLSTIERAFVQTDTTDDVTTERLALRADSTNVALEPAFGSASRVDAVDRINSWLRN